MRKKWEACPLCEASFQLVEGKFPQHRSIYTPPLCECSGKTLAQAEELLRALEAS